MELGIMKIVDMGFSGTARKICYKLNNKNYYFYYYTGNVSQSFVADEEGNNITNSKLGMNIKCSGMNYIFCHDYKNGN